MFDKELLKLFRYILRKNRIILKWRDDMHHSSEFRIHYAIIKFYFHIIQTNNISVCWPFNVLLCCDRLSWEYLNEHMKWFNETRTLSLWALSYLHLTNKCQEILSFDNKYNHHFWWCPFLCEEKKKVCFFSLSLFWILNEILFQSSCSVNI